jgi:hypothetical protein
MIVSESDILLAGLDRRMQVDRVQAVDPLEALSRATGPVRTAPLQTGGSAATGPANATADPATRLPLGQVITARVVEVPQPDHVIVEVGDLRIALAWPKAGGVPQPGRDIGLRVLAHKPMLLFQSVPDDAMDATDAHEDGEPLTRWSSDALHLQAPGTSGGAPGRGAGPVRFDTPILEIEIVPLQDSKEPAVANELVQSRAQVPTDREAPARIELDDVIVARSTAVVDGVAAPLVPRAVDDGTRIPTTFLPLILQGPAWAGQAMELVVRRERRDEQFDNPALDHWCGEVVIDLPHLGRVAGHLAFSMQGLRIRLEGGDARAVDAMTAGATELANAFSMANLRVCALSVGGQAADTRRPGPTSPFAESRDG